MSDYITRNGQGRKDWRRMDDREIEVAMDAIAQALIDRGKTADAVREYLRAEAERVAQEIEDEALNEVMR